MCLTSQNVIEDIILQHIRGAKPVAGISVPVSVRIKADLYVPHSLCIRRFTNVTIDRGYSFKTFLNAAQKRNLCYKRYDRYSNPWVAIFAAPGGGKSYMIDYLADNIRALPKNSSCLADSVVVSVSFSDASSTPVLLELDSKMRAEFGIAVRVLWSYLVDLKGTTLGDFECFYRYVHAAAPQLLLDSAIRAVQSHSGKDRVLLLVDELLKTLKCGVNWPAQILSSIASTLDCNPTFNSAVTCVDPTLLVDFSVYARRPIVWITLPPFTLRESESIFADIVENPTLCSCPKLLATVRLCISDIGGHPRGLEVLHHILMKVLSAPTVDPKCLLDAIMIEFDKLSNVKLSTEVVAVALKGTSVRLKTCVGDKTVQELISSGTYLNSEIAPRMSPSEIVPRLSIMQLRVFGQKDNGATARCLRTTILQERAPMNMQGFHIQWEVLTRHLGKSEVMSMASFYSREPREYDSLPAASRETLIHFRAKPDGIVSFDHPSSIFSCTPDMAYFRSCRAVFLGMPAQHGFEYLIIEEKAGGGFVAIVIYNEDCCPTSGVELAADVPGKKWNDAMIFLQNRVLQKLGITMDDCCLVLTSWFSEDVGTLQKKQLAEKKSQVVILGRKELMNLYTPTLISRPHLITGDNSAQPTKIVTA